MQANEDEDPGTNYNPAGVGKGLSSGDHNRARQHVSLNGHAGRDSVLGSSTAYTVLPNVRQQIACMTSSIAGVSVFVRSISCSTACAAEGSRPGRGEGSQQQGSRAGAQRFDRSTGQRYGGGSRSDRGDGGDRQGRGSEPPATSFAGYTFPPVVVPDQDRRGSFSLEDDCLELKILAKDAFMQ